VHAIFDQRRYLIPFRAVLLPQIFTDVLVIGSGVAGLRAALEAAAHSDVIVLAKSKLTQSNTAWAQGGIAAVLDQSDDSFDEHIANTLEAGAGLCDEQAVERIITAAPDRILELVAMGAQFDRDDAGRLLLGREGGHTHNRIVHAHGDATGKEVAETLVRTTRSHDRIRLFEQCFGLDLITEAGPGTRCVGAVTHHPKYGLQVIWARATILATGGCGQVYRETTNSPIATGDGHAMAYRAGAKLADMEFEQFHPTTLYIAGASRSLISEAVRGEGAYLVNRDGRRFMQGEHELAELAPRDIVSRAILRQITNIPGAQVFLDTRHIGRERFAQRFPGIYRQLQQFGLDPGKDLIPIRPAMHYMIGGVVVDEQSRTSVPGLYAAGEVACTGLHGANRLASNSLLEGLVCGQIAGATCAEAVQRPATLPIKIVSDIPISDRSELDVADVRSTLRSVMWRHVGIERTGDRLKEVAEMLDFWARYTLDKIFDDRDGWEVQNELLAGALITRAAIWRTESRGTHFRTDFPDASDYMRVRAVWTAGNAEPQTAALAGARE
jgi:L-aspartate oxidase